MKKKKEIYSVRCILHLPKHRLSKKKHTYEERITLWRAYTANEAMEKAEKEALDYMDNVSKRLLSRATTSFIVYDEYEMSSKSDQKMTFKNGQEVFSLLRTSELSPAKYLKTFFITGDEYVSFED